MAFAPPHHASQTSEMQIARIATVRISARTASPGDKSCKDAILKITANIYYCLSNYINDQCDTANSGNHCLGYVEVINGCTDDDYTVDAGMNRKES